MFSAEGDGTEVACVVIEILLVAVLPEAGPDQQPAFSGGQVKVESAVVA